MRKYEDTPTGVIRVSGQSPPWFRFEPANLFYAIVMEYLKLGTLYGIKVHVCLWFWILGSSRLGAGI